MTERHLGAVKATSGEMPSFSTVWIGGDVQGVPGTFELSVSNTEPTLTLTVKLADGVERIEKLDVTPLLQRWVYGIVNERVIQN